MNNMYIRIASIARLTEIPKSVLLISSYYKNGCIFYYFKFISAMNYNIGGDAAMLSAYAASNSGFQYVSVSVRML